MSWDVAPSQDEVTQGWGCTDYAGEWYAPWCPAGHYHAGIDLGYSGGGNATCGRPVYATRNGTVVAVGANGQGNAGFSQYLGPNAVCIRYDDGIFVEHGHLSAAHVAVGQRVAPGTHIGDIGTLGASTACHLHVEARVDGPYQGVANNAANVRDPRPYLSKLPVPAPPPVPHFHRVRLWSPTDGVSLDGFGGLHALGVAAPSGGPSWPGWDIARDVAILSDHSGGYVLDGFGGIHAFSLGTMPPAATGFAYWQGWDIARSIVLLPDDSGGFVMDAWGGLHPFSAKGGAPAVPTGYPYWPGWEIARDLIVAPSGGGYTLDGWGGVHAWGGAPLAEGYTYWKGWDIARAIALIPGGGGGYTLDGWGGLHPWAEHGSAPPPAAVGGPYWSGWDIARGLALDSTGGGVVLDGLGGVHHFT